MNRIGRCTASEQRLLTVCERPIQAPLDMETYDPAVWNVND
jgi:hypothetical protein